MTVSEIIANPKAPGTPRITNNLYNAAIAFKKGLMMIVSNIERRIWNVRPLIVCVLWRDGVRGLYDHLQ